MKKELCAVRIEYDSAYFQWQKEKNSLQKQNQTLAAKIISLEQEKKCGQERIDVLIAESKSSGVQIEQLKKENKMLAARSKQFQSGVVQNMEHNGTQKQEKDTTEKQKKDVYEVENILDHKFTKNQRRFLVRWKGFNSNHDTWEPEKCLNCPKILNTYLK